MCASFPQKNKTLPLIFSLMLKALLNRNCLPSLKVICFSNTSSFQYFIPNNLSLDSWCMTLHTSLYDFVFCHVRLSKRVPYVCGGYEGGSREKSWQNTPFTRRATAGINMLFYRPGSFGRMAFEEIAGKSLFTVCQKSLPSMQL